MINKELSQVLKKNKCLQALLLKKKLVCTNCNKPGHSKENCWAKGGGKEGQGSKQQKQKQFKKKKGKYKANAAEESSDGSKKLHSDPIF